MFAASFWPVCAARFVMALLIAGASSVTVESANAGVRSESPAALAGVDFLPASPLALYPGGTAFAAVSRDGEALTLQVLNPAGAILAGRMPSSDSQLLAWDGRDVDGLPVRAGNARLLFQSREEGQMIELHSKRLGMHGGAGVSFSIRSTAR